MLDLRLTPESDGKEERVLAANRAAFHNYHISDKYEAALPNWTEVKSAMDGRVQLKEAYVSVREGERVGCLMPHLTVFSRYRENHEPFATPSCCFINAELKD